MTQCKQPRIPSLPQFTPKQPLRALMFRLRASLWLFLGSWSQQAFFFLISIHLHLVDEGSSQWKLYTWGRIMVISAKLSNCMGAWTVSCSFLCLSCKVKSTYHNSFPGYKYKQIIHMDNNLWSDGTLWSKSAASAAKPLLYKHMEFITDCYAAISKL